MAPPGAWQEHTQKCFGDNCRYLNMAEILNDMKGLLIFENFLCEIKVFNKNITLFLKDP